MKNHYTTSNSKDNSDIFDNSDKRKVRRYNKNHIIDLGTADEADKIMK